ncbi:MAG: RNA-binding protein [Candidatus Thorarchaeota archaeon]|jgi:PUA domain protein
MPKIERIKRRHFLKKKEQKRELERMGSELGVRSIDIGPDARLEAGMLDTGTRILMLEGVILFFELEEMNFPTLHSLLQGFVTLPRIVVDMGAVKFVANGADIMRPGVTHADDGIQEGSVVAIVDETHGKPLAVGTAIMSTQEILAADKGKVALSKHHINDDLWTFSRG